MNMMLEAASPRKVDETAFYDSRWENEFGQPVRGRKLTRISAILHEVAALSLHEPAILEIGSGTGALAGILRHAGCITGIELSSKAVEFSSRRYPDVSFLAGSIFDIQLPAASYDLVISHEVIEHVDDQAGMIERIHQMLKTGGQVILTTPNATVAERSGLLRRAEMSGGLQPKENLLTVRQLRQLMAPRFEILRLYTVVHAGRDGVYRVLNSPRLLRFRGWRRLIGELRFGLHTIVVARAK